MKIHPAEQGSADWMIARSGIPTASEFDQLVTPAFAARDGEMPRTYLAKKLAERWLGGPLAGFSTFDTDQGQILEEEAVPFYELEYGETIQRVGLITTDDGKVGCSPDGLLKVGGIECKCPEAHTHCKWLLDGKVPKEHILQVQGSMFVTGAKVWKFFSYRRRFQVLLLTVERDEEAMEVLAEALDDFNTKLDLAYERLCDKNGGPPKRSAIPSTPSPSPQFTPTENDYPN